MAKEIIKRVSFFKAISPLSRPIADSTHQISEIAFIVTRLALAGGVSGDAYLLAFHYSPHALAGALRDIRALAKGLRRRVVDWVNPLIDHPIRICDGFAYPNDAPGRGFRFKDDQLTELK